MSRTDLPVTRVLERAVDRLIGGASVVSEFLVAGLAVVVSLDAILRWLADWSFQFVDEIGGYAVLLLSFFGMAIALRRDALFRVDVLIDRLRTRTRAGLLLIYDLVALGFAAILCWQLGSLALRSFDRAITAPTILRTPLWIPQALMACGVFLLVLVLVVQIIQRVRQLGPSHPESSL
ncbi:MAG: hypothetical protein RL322_264 [Pseudomonadota bacterium]